MSKVKGNVIDPLDLIHGATFAEMRRQDAPRRARGRGAREVQEGVPVGRADGRPASRRSAPTRCASRWRPTRRATSASRSRRSASRATGTSCNKIWNATRLALDLPRAAYARRDRAPPRADGLLQPLDPLAPRARARGGARAGSTTFRIDEAAQRALPLLLERPLRLVPRARQAGPAQAPDGDFRTRVVPRDAGDARVRARGAACALLHPLMPFITEELWQRVPKAGGHPASIALAPYPAENAGAR